MSLLSRISTGRRGRAQKVVIYAPEGFGKSTIASQFPSPLFLDIEDSTSQLDVARLGPSDMPTLNAFESALAEIVKGRPCSTLVVDTADWLEALTLDDIIAASGDKDIRGVEDFGYGKGYTKLKERMTITLAKLDAVIAAGISVVLLAHSKVNKFEPPDSNGNPFDRYELKLSKQVAPLVKEWADMLLFGNWRVQIRERDKNTPGAKFKGIGGKERVLYAERCAAWDAKNRHGMKAEDKWDIAVIESAFRAVGAPWGEVVTAMNASTGEVAKLNANAVDTSAQDVIDRKAETSKHFAPSGADADLARICEPHAEAINDYLRSNGRIRPNETWQDMPHAFADRVKRNPVGFLKIVNGKELAAK